MALHWMIWVGSTAAVVSSLGLASWTSFVEPKRQLRFRSSFLKSFKAGLKLRAPVVESYFEEVDALASALCRKLRKSKALVLRANLLRRSGFCGVNYELLHEHPFDYWSEEQLNLFEAHLSTAVRLSQQATFLRKEAKVLEWVDRPFFLHKSSEPTYFAARVLRIAHDYNLSCSLYGLEIAREKIESQPDAYDPVLVSALAEVLHWNRDVSRNPDPIPA